jgi:hypothetical protein
MYLVNTRPNICFYVNTLSHFVVESRKVHWIEKEHVIRYLRGTMEYGLRYLGGYVVELQGYTNSNWVGGEIDRKSTSGCCFSLGSRIINWLNGNHNFVSFSSIVEDYMVVSMASCEAIWIHKLLMCLFDQKLDPMVVYCNN